MKTLLHVHILTLASGLALLSPAALADCAIKFDVNNASQGIKSQVIKVKGDKVLIDDVGGDPSIDVLFDSKTMAMKIINHQKKTYLNIDKEKIATLSNQANNMMAAVEEQMEAQLAGISPQQRKQLKAMIAKMGMGAIMQKPKQPTARSFVKAGTKKVNNTQCQQYTVNQDSNKVGEVCIASPSDLKISNADYQNLLALQRFGESLVKQAGSMAGKFGINVPSFSGKAFDGIPIEMIDLSNTGSTMKLSTINHDTLNVADFQIPAGYQAQALPTLPGAPR